VYPIKRKHNHTLRISAQHFCIWSLLWRRMVQNFN